jgi:ABC-type multidrug transport system fused ATPase/permease subunit
VIVGPLGNGQIGAAALPRGVYRRSLSYFREDAGNVVAVVLLMVLSTAVGLAMAWPMAVLVDAVLAAHPSEAPIPRLFLRWLPEDTVGRIVRLAALTLVLKLVQDLLNMLRTLLSNKLNYSGLMRVRRDLFRKLQSMSLAYHRERPLGDAIYRLSTDTFGCQTVLGVFLSTLVAIFTLSGMLAILLSRSVSLTLIAVSITPLLVAANVWFSRTLKRHSTEAKEQDMAFLSNAQRSMASISLVQAFGREAEEQARFHATVQNSIRAWLRLTWEEVTYWLIVGTVFGLGGALVFGYGGYLVHTGELTVGELLVFVAYLGMLWDPLCKLTGATASAQGGAAGAARVFEILDRTPIIKDVPRARALPLQPREVRFERVTFEYEPGRPVLRELSAVIRPGEMVAFVGPSGTGKSTVLNLLPRFYDPVRGAVLYDGIDARRVRIRDLRRHVALALQDSLVLPTTIAENIAYGNPEASSPSIREALELSGAAEFVFQLPQGLDTVVAENGANLSGGQRQRIAIARALLSHAPIIVLDEPTSALDPERERWVARTLLSLKRLRSIVVVTHRLHTVVDADRIYVLDAGRAVEQGTHDELMRARGRYYRMYSSEAA